ncbi:hypothetical protein Pmani_030242, partial [Petrolisthes manimaculis]
ESWCYRSQTTSRVYASAPSGVAVTAVRVVDEANTHSRAHIRTHTPHPSPQYFLHESNLTDHRYFYIDQEHAILPLLDMWNRGKGDEYHLIVMALVSGQAIKQVLTVTVTEYNQHKPTFTLQSYSAEVLTTAQMGSRVVTVAATDDDDVYYNRELTYFLARPSSSSHTSFTLNVFLEPPLDLPITIEERTGVVRVSRHLRLSDSPLRLLVGVVDGGSPQRYHLANLTVYIRDIPESSLTVCWAPPISGRTPLGYLLSYTPTEGQRSLGKGSLNLTIDQLHSNMFPQEHKREGVDVNNNRSLEKQHPTITTGDVDVYRYCAVVGGLARWTEYVVGVRAWRTGQVSIPAIPAVSTTRSDYCAMGVCGSEGNCSLHDSPPGYMCSCMSGWFGLHCQHHNPCSPHNPCLHFGKCTNESDGSYRCDCPRGFYGQNCSLIDPCTAVPANPCSNGGSCLRSSQMTQTLNGEESGEYTCICPEGYFGAMCEHLDPCQPNPCQHTASCTNLTHHQYACHCPPGYTGLVCESEVNECDPNPCLRGTCHDHLNDFTCTCPKGWGGKTCDRDLESCPGHTTRHTTGEFHWPNTHHGHTVTLTCPYGVRVNAEELLGSSGFMSQRAEEEEEEESSADLNAKRLNNDTPLSSQIMSDGAMQQHSIQPHHHIDSNIDSPFRSQIMNDEQMLQHNKESHHTTRATARKEQDFIVKRRRKRDVDKIKTHHQQESAQEARRRMVAESIQGTSQRLAERRYQHKRERERLMMMQERQRRRGGGDEESIRTQQHRRNMRKTSEVGEVGRAIEEMGREMKGGESTHTTQHRRKISSEKRSEIGEVTTGEGENPQPQGRAITSSSSRRRSRAHSHPIGSGSKMHFTSDIKRIIHPTDSHSSITMNSESNDKHIMQPTNSHSSNAMSERHITGTTALQSSEKNVPGHSEIISTHLDQFDTHEEKQNVKHFRRQTSLPAHLSLDHFQAPDYKNPANLTLRNYPHQERRHDEFIGSVGHERRIQHVSGGVYSSNINDGLNSSPSQVRNSQSAHHKSLHRLTGEEGAEASYKPGKHINPNMSPLMPVVSPVHEVGAMRACVLLANGTVAWLGPSTVMCREEAAQVAEDAAKDVASLTSTPSDVDSQVFTQAANQLSMIVPQALQDAAVASNVMNALSNMMEVNDSVVESDITSQIVNTINTLTANVVVKVGQSVRLRSENLVLEARMVDSSSNESITFHPERKKTQNINTTPTADSRKKRTTNSKMKESFLSLPGQILKMAGTEKVRVEFVSYANDKFFRRREGGGGGDGKEDSSFPSGLPVITARVTTNNNTPITNLNPPVQYHIPVDHSRLDTGVRPVCVFWDEQTQDWSDTGMTTLHEADNGVLTCQATHLTAFSILLDPLPSKLGAHATALSIITYIGLALSTAGLIATVATYALFRSLNRDRSGKVVMNLSLALLLLNLVFMVGVQLKPPSIACTSFAALLHYLVVAAFAWMLVEAANMYQLLITVFASSETHFMAKRMVAGWGVPALPVICALVWDTSVYGDTLHGHCVISPNPNPAVYYTTYLVPICLVLAVNCVVFVLVTRVLCQRRPRSHKPKSPTKTRCHTKELPITLAQIRGAVTVVALLGVTWVAGALSVGGARLTLQYIFCLATPLQGLIIFIVRVAQHPEARASWLTLLTEGTLRKRPQTTTVSHSTQSSAHTTHSTSSSTLTPLKSLSHTTSTRASLKGSIKSTLSTKSSLSTQGNGSTRNYGSGRRNVKVRKQSGQEETSDGNKSSIGKMFSHLVSRWNSDGGGEGMPHEGKKVTPVKNNDQYGSPPVITAGKTNVDKKCTSLSLSQDEYSSTTPPPLQQQQESYIKELIPQEDSYHNTKNSKSESSVGRPHSMVLLRTDSHGGVLRTKPTTIITHGCTPGSNLPHRLPHLCLLPQEELLEAGIPSSMIPSSSTRRSLGSLMHYNTEGKEGDDSSWHFVRPPPDGRSDTPQETDVIKPPSSLYTPSSDTQLGNNVVCTMKEKQQMIQTMQGGNEEKIDKSTCIVLAGQRVTTTSTNQPVTFSTTATDQPVQFSRQNKGNLTRANSELYMNSPEINHSDLRRSASVYTLGEWEDPRASLA